MERALRAVVLVDAWNDSTSWTGTGFLWHDRDAEPPMLVTNRHVVEPATGIRFSVPGPDEAGGPVVVHTFKKEPIPRHHRIDFPDDRVDVCVLDVGELRSEQVQDESVGSYAIGFTSDHLALDRITPGQDAYVFGYPDGIRDTSHWAPVTRRGAVATRPGPFPQSDGSFLVDCTVYPGSSGSPVFVDDREGGGLVGIMAARQVAPATAIGAAVSGTDVWESLDLGFTFGVDLIMACTAELGFRQFCRDGLCVYAGIGNNKVRLVRCDRDGRARSASRETLELDLQESPAWPAHVGLRYHRTFVASTGYSPGLYGGNVDEYEELTPSRPLATVLAERAEVIRSQLAGLPVADTLII